MNIHTITRGVDSVLADSLLNKLKLILSDLAFEYPFFMEWLEKVFLELKSSDNRIILLYCENDIFDIKGVSILKKTKEERKICTLRVVNPYRYQGIGTCLLKKSIELLEDSKPLITVSGIHMKEFVPFLKKHGFILRDKVKSLYRRGCYEYFFNVSYKHKFVLLSIKPEYAIAIAEGRKKVEFRKRMFADSVERAFVYSSSPVKKIIGSFPVGYIAKNTPDKIWKEYSMFGCISEKKYFDYFFRHDIAYGIGIPSFDSFDTPFDPYKVDTKFRPPQSFCYIDNVEFIKKLYADYEVLPWLGGRDGQKESTGR